MKHLRINLGLVVVSLTLLACGGRVAKPIAEKNSWDSQLSCSHLFGEYKNHDKRLVELTGESKDKPVHNLGMLLSSPLFLDLSKSQQYEATAIYKRQARLKSIMKTKQCHGYQTLEENDTPDSRN